MSTEASEPELELDALLEYLRVTRGFDFSGYKRGTLKRRIDKRMTELGIPGYGAYQDYLEVHPGEFSWLFNTILINVTSFFRDPAAWEALHTHLSGRLGDDSGAIRVWVAGCSSGEEAYSVAIALTELLGPEAFQRRVKIYATDVDDDALEAARQGTFTEKAMEGINDDRRERYYTPANGGTGNWTFRTPLRRSLIFGRNDLIQDAPISRLTLLVCRNTLMYFNAEMQARILTRFHFALNEGALLFLGKSETMLTKSDLFEALDSKYRIFLKTTADTSRERLFNLTQHKRERERPTHEPATFEATAFDAAPVAQIMVGANGLLALFNREARRLFALDRRDLGRRFQDLELSYRPLELRSRIEEALNERRPVTAKDVERRLADGSVEYFDVQITPVSDENGTQMGVSITFTDMSRYRQLRRDLVRSNQELETAYEELQSTNEELETTNEELQSTVEELETTNEELQSTNEELETMNEELQSTNEELEGINGQLERRTEEVDRSNFFLESILGSLRSAVFVVDHNFEVVLWKGRAEDLWGLRADEVIGHSLFSLDIGLPLDQLREPIRAALDGEDRSLRVQALTRRGKTIECNVTFLPLRRSIRPEGVVVLLEEQPEA